MGALPSGSDPSQFDAGDWGLVGPGMTALSARTEANVRALLRQQHVDNSEPWLELDHWFGNLWKALGDFNPRDPDFDAGTWGQQFIQVVLSPFIRILNPLLGREEQGNLLADGGFNHPPGVLGDGWSYVSDVGRTPPLGAILAEPSGPDMALRSNPIAVAEEQKLAPSVHVQWDNVVATGDAFTLDIVTYYQTQYTGVINIDKVTNPGSSGSWRKLEGTWTVPAGVDEVRIRLQIKNTTSGSVWFDDAVLAKTTVFQHISQNTIDGIVNGFLGLFGIAGHDSDRVADAVKAQADTTVGTTAQMMQILAALGDGTPDADDFERLNLLSLGPNWVAHSVGGGILSTGNGHDAIWGGSGDSQFLAYKNNVLALTDNQTATVVLSSSPESLPWFAAPTEFGYNSILLRATAFTSWATRTGLECRFGADKTITIWWLLSGVETLLLSGTTDVVPGKGAVLEFSAGTTAEPRHFTARINGTPVLDATEVGTTSTYGATQRRRGFGGVSQTSPLLGTAQPGAVKQWTAQG